MCVILDSGPEQETAKRLLAKVKKKLQFYEETHEIPHKQTKDYSTSTSFEFDDFCNQTYHWHVHFEDDKNYYEDTRSEAEMANDLGILYAIFGSTYQTALNYHIYKIRFKKQTTPNGAFFRVYSDIYEDDIRICKDVKIGFWPCRFRDDRCGDMEISTMDGNLIEKYGNGCWSLYLTLLDELKDIWNFYFDSQTSAPMLTEYSLGYHESCYPNSSNNKFKVQLNQEQRKAIIDKTENEIASGKMKRLESMASTFIITAYKPYNILSEFLEESGVVYKVETSGVYIFQNVKRKFGKLVGYEYSKPTRSYCLYLI